MQKILLLFFISFVSLQAAQNIWSQDTKGMQHSHSEQIIDAYLLGDDLTKLSFEDDPKIKKRKLTVVDNIFMLGVSVGDNSAYETIENTTGSKSITNSAYEVKFTVGKDFTFLHERYTQATRLYFNINYASQAEDVEVYGWSVGLRENMYYWAFYKTPTFTIYPTLSLELGNATMKRDDLSVNGFTMEMDMGITYQRDENFEYFINVKIANNTWDYASAGESFKGVAYETLYHGLLIGLNYKFNYGDL